MHKSDQPQPVDLLTPEEAAAILGVTPANLQMRRHQNRPPRFYKLGSGSSNVRYSRQDLLDYLDSCLVDPSQISPDKRGFRS